MRTMNIPVDGERLTPSSRPIRMLEFAPRLLLLAALALGCAPPAAVPEHAAFEVGMDRSVILERFGPPEREQVMFKQSAAIWGPIEDFWPQVPDGAKVEIWSYRSRARLVEGSDDTTPGSSELYFVEGSPTVQGVGFAPDGVVY